ncbi:MAG: FAD-dependent oxidoreductase [Balneolaceae bacterium]|nr:FAD-dependent oxidoreductase [Balneolaceae bacterium]
MNDTITVIGGGISGITTAFTLQLLGFKTSCYSKHFVTPEAPDNPRFASLYPAASIIPHSVFSNQSEKLFQHSQSIFKLLLKHKVKGIKKHLHYEIYEFEKDDPSYAKSLENYQRVENLNTHKLQIPSRLHAPNLHGWAFKCIVAEWPTYISNLYNWYEKAGGELVQQKVDPQDIKNLKSNVIINCTGIWSSKLFDDSAPLKVVKGHLLYIHDAPLFKDDQGNIPSYNYTPHNNIYTDPQGNPTDVYCYPRTTGLALGGSREKGIINESGIFIGEENSDTIEMGGLNIPRQIYELNKEILLNTYDFDIRKYSSLEAKAAYRYIRSEDRDGLRIDTSKEFGKKIIHNYGHGGAGVTLSWGCALEVAQKINDFKLHELSNKLNHLLNKIV